MLRRHTAFALSLVALVAFSAHAKISRKGDPSVSFFAKGTVPGLSINGKTNELNELNVSDDGTNVVVTVPLGKLTTGIELRDKHLKEKYLNVAQFPNAQLTIAHTARKIAPDGDVSGDAEGSLKIHGQAKNVKFHFDAKRDGTTFHVSTKFTVNMMDFGIEKPSHLGVGVKPDVEIEAKFDAEDK